MLKKDTELGKIKEKSKALLDAFEYCYDGKGDIYDVKINHYRRMKKIWQKTRSHEEINKYINKYANTQVKSEGVISSN